MAKTSNNDVEQFLELKRKVERYQKEQERAAGAYDQLMSELASEFGCKSLKEAKRLLAEMEKTEQEQSKLLREGLAKFEEKWGDKLQ